MLYKFSSWYSLLLSKDPDWFTLQPTLVTSTQGWAAVTLRQTLVSGIGHTYCPYFVSESWERWWHVNVVTGNVCRPQWISGSVTVTVKKSAHSPTWTYYSCRQNIWFSTTAPTLPISVTPVNNIGLWVACCRFSPAYIGPDFYTFIPCPY
jgi:hypothetical protein